LVVATFGLVVAGLGTALALRAPAAIPPSTTVTLPRVTQLPPATMPPSVVPAAPTSSLPPVVDATSAPLAAPAVVEHTVRHQPSPAPRPKAALTPAPAPQQEDAPAPSPPPAVEVEEHRSVRDDLRTLGEQIEARVDQRLERLKARLDD
jgi:hypothetical protein